jgi:hypothetical protein
MEVERTDDWVIFQYEDGRYFANVLEGVVSDPFDTIDQARHWAFVLVGNKTVRDHTLDPALADFDAAVDRMDAKLTELEAAIRTGEVTDRETMRLAAGIRVAIDHYRQSG